MILQHNLFKPEKVDIILDGSESRAEINAKLKAAHDAGYTLAPKKKSKKNNVSQSNPLFNE